MFWALVYSVGQEIQGCSAWSGAGFSWNIPQSQREQSFSQSLPAPRRDYKAISILTKTNCQYLLPALSTCSFQCCRRKTSPSLYFGLGSQEGIKEHIITQDLNHFASWSLQRQVPSIKSSQLDCPEHTWVSGNIHRLASMQQQRN